MFKPFTQAIFGMKTDMNEVKDTIRSIKDVSAPITGEVEDESEMRKIKEENDYLDAVMHDTKQSDLVADKYETKGGVLCFLPFLSAKILTSGAVHSAVYFAFLINIVIWYIFIFIKNGYHYTYFKMMIFMLLLCFSIFHVLLIVLSLNLLQINCIRISFL